MNNIRIKGREAFFWDFSGKIAMQGVSFIVSIFLARLLEPSDFGLIAIVMVFIAFTGIFVDMGLGTALIQRKRLLSVHYSSVFYFNILIAILFTLLLSGLSFLIALFYKNEILVSIIQVMSILFIINALGSVQTIIFRKNLDFKLLAKISFISAFISGMVGIFLALYDFGVWSLVSQIILMSVILNSLLYIFGSWRPRQEFSLKALKQLWGFGFPMFLASLISSIFEKLDYLIIARLFNFTILGYYQRAVALDRLIITYSSSSLMSILFPLLSKIQNNLKQFQLIVVKFYSILNFIVFFLLGLFYLIAEELIRLLFSEKWLLSVTYFEILLLGGFVYPLSALLVNILSSRGKSKAYLKLEIYKRLILLSNFLVAFQWGVIGYLYGLVIVSVLSLYLNILFASREIMLPIKVFVLPIIIQIVIVIPSVSLVFFLVTFLNYDYSIILFIKMLLFIAIYLMFNHIFQLKSYLYFKIEIEVILKELFKGTK